MSIADKTQEDRAGVVNQILDILLAYNQLSAGDKAQLTYACPELFEAIKAADDNWFTEE